MNSRTIDVVTDWETVTASDGYEGLHTLADSGFSGAVSAGMTWAFFLNGRVVGVFEGGIEDFEGEPLTAYRAADSSLPLLFAMQEGSTETRAKYYTNETPLRDADKTLSNGGFTGYVELSENVLSGDYYVVYHGGKSMSAAFVGNSGRLITGDEAFETAADEVGIYEVVDADVELVDIPAVSEPDTDDAPAAADDESADAAADEVEAETDEAEADAAVVAEDTAEDASDDGLDGVSEVDDAPEVGRDQHGVSDPAEAPEPTNGPSPDAGSADDPETAAEVTASESAGATAPDASAAEPAIESAEAVETQSESTAPVTPAESSDTTEATEGPEPSAATGTAATSGQNEVFSDEARWREARTIPSLDPGESSSNGSTSARETNSRATSDRSAQSQRRQAASRRAQQRDAGAQRAAARTKNGDTSAAENVERLKKRLTRARARIETLEDEREGLDADSEAKAERIETLEAEVAEQRERIAELEAERESLQAEVDRLRSETGSAAAGDTTMAPEQALSGTNLFVRYDRKGEATLNHAHAGDASREDVTNNLRLEHHTTFETDGLVVDEQPYAEFLHSSTEYAFANWLVTDLLYEIGETGNRTAMAGVFDAIPDVDRIELYGRVGVDTDDGVEQRDFDVIFRDKMGDPLFVADINDSRNATTEAMVGSLVNNTGVIAENDETLSAGFYVTESFYEPGALETVSEETGGGLLSRSKKRSFVKVSRKQGYHLCLVEARNGEFHLNVPDL